MLLFLLLSCGPHYVPPSAPTSSALPLANVPKVPDLSSYQQIATGSGLVYAILRNGAGEFPRAGQLVTIHYNGWLAGGDLFDSSYRRGQPFTFKLDSGMVIQGFDESVRGMRPGERRVVIIPPNLGYGATGAGGMIPPNATLIFELELLKAE